MYDNFQERALRFLEVGIHAHGDGINANCDGINADDRPLSDMDCIFSFGALDICPFFLVILPPEKYALDGLFWCGQSPFAGDYCGGSFYSSRVPSGECAYRWKLTYARLAKGRYTMAVAISARMKALVKNGIRGNFAVIDDPMDFRVLVDTFLRRTGRMGLVA